MVCVAKEYSWPEVTKVSEIESEAQKSRLQRRRQCLSTISPFSHTSTLLWILWPVVTWLTKIKSDPLALCRKFLSAGPINVMQAGSAQLSFLVQEGSLSTLFCLTVYVRWWRWFALMVDGQHQTKKRKKLWSNFVWSRYFCSFMADCFTLKFTWASPAVFLIQSIL